MAVPFPEPSWDESDLTQQQQSVQSKVFLNSFRYLYYYASALTHLTSHDFDT